MLAILLSLLLLLAQSPGGEVARTTVREPAYAPDGRLVVEIDGDLWASGEDDGHADLDADEMVRLTSGPAWDRDPVWADGGRAVIFASDRGGSTDLWRIEVDGRGRPGETTRWTESDEPDTDPTVDAAGRTVFVRGRGDAADLWLREADGSEWRLVGRAGGESSPAFAPDGTRLAYVSGRQVRVLELEAVETETDGGMGPGAGSERAHDVQDRDGQSGAVQDADGRDGSGVDTATQDAADQDADAPGADRTLRPGADETVDGTSGAVRVAWSPDASRLAFTRFGGDAGVYVVEAAGGWPTRLLEAVAAPAFSPDGTVLALAELPEPGPGYNGDPDRLGDRTVGDIFPSAPGEGRFWIVEAPEAVDAAAAERELAVTTERESYNGEAFDRVWERLASLYYEDDDRRAAWEALRETHRPRALAAATTEELEGVIHEMLAERPPARDEAAGRAAVSSAHPLATAAGIEILEKGGNVVDAAVAVSFALGVVEPDASGIGGYGQMVLSLAGMDAPTAIEFLTRVPEDATLDNAALDGATGPMLANVPGTVRGMELAWERYGSGEVGWAELVEPAIRIAEEGFVLDDAFTTTLALERDRFLAWESSRELFFRDGEPLGPGDTFRNPDLAWTLRQIADGGADAFYEGEVARRLVRDLRGRGNAMTEHDMARYFAVEREPVVGTYRGHTVASAAPAVSGGVSLVAKLHLLDNTSPFGLYRDDPAALHALVEAWKLQPSSRGRLADPSLWPVDIESVIDRDAAGRRWLACFDPERATSAEELESGSGGDPACLAEGERVAFHLGEDVPSCAVDERGCLNTGTTAFAVADADGNMVAVTQTLGTWGGNFYVTPGLGFLYNDKLRSYGSNPDSYGARLPYARNSTSIAPTLVFRGTGDDAEPLLAVGAAGNAWITSAVYQVITGVIDGGLGPQQALELPRFLLSGRRGPGGDRQSVILHEDGLDPEVMRRLREMGHAFRAISLRGEMRMGYGAAVLVEEGRVRAGADPRRSGAAEAVR